MKLRMTGRQEMKRYSDPYLVTFFLLDIMHLYNEKRKHLNCFSLKSGNFYYFQKKILDSYRY